MQSLFSQINQKQTLNHVPTEHIHNASGPALINESDKFEDIYLDACIESWLPLIEQHTFYTELLPLQPADCLALYNACDLLLNKHTISSLDDIYNNNNPDYTELKTALQSIEQRLDVVIANVAKHSGRPDVFIKPSSRSAKDVMFKNPCVVEKYLSTARSALQTFAETHPTEAADQHTRNNIKLHAMLTAGLENLRYTTAYECLTIFIQSLRSIEDLQLINRLSPQRFEFSFAVREFVEIYQDEEFRAFIYNNKLTCFSQYNHILYSERLVQQKHVYQDKIKTFIEDQVLPALFTTTQHDKTTGNNNGACVLDIAIDTTGKCWVIELNPFADSVDSALFSWRDQDCVDIMKGEKPFEFRVRTEVHQNLTKVLSPECVKFMDLVE